MGKHRGLPLHSGTLARRCCSATSRLRNCVGAAHVIRKAAAGTDFICGRGRLSPAGGGESAVADLGVELCLLDFLRCGLQLSASRRNAGAIRMGRHRGLPLH
jgi:hypothetical protein